MNSENRLLVSYFTLRKLIGWMAILVPFILALLNWILFRGGLGSSVSSYYHTNVGRVFVGTLCSIGVFLLAYKGYKRLDTDKIYQFSDNIVANLAACSLSVSPFSQALLWNLRKMTKSSRLFTSCSPLCSWLLWRISLFSCSPKPIPPM